MSTNQAVDLRCALSEIFACSAETAGRIASYAVDKSYPVGATVLHQGENTEHTYLVADGRAHAITHSQDGQSVLLLDYGRGDMFGALTDSGQEPLDADVVAIETLRTAVFRLLDFLQLVDTHSCVSRALVRMLLKQLRATSTRMAQRTILSAAGRVHAELLRLAREKDGWTITPVPVITQLAVRVQSTRETVSRTINALERRGIIRREADALIIVAPRLLEDMIV